MNEKNNQVSVLTLNPAVDISYEIPQLLEYQKVRAKKTWYHPGGQPGRANIAVLHSLLYG